MQLMPLTAAAFMSWIRSDPKGINIAPVRLLLRDCRTRFGVGICRCVGGLSPVKHASGKNRGYAEPARHAALCRSGAGALRTVPGTGGRQPRCSTPWPAAARHGIW